MDFHAAGWLLAVLVFAPAFSAPALAQAFEAPEAAWSESARYFDGWSGREDTRPGRYTAAAFESASGDPERSARSARDRRNVVLSTLGIFGLVLMAWDAVVRNPKLRNGGATLLVVGFFLLALL